MEMGSCSFSASSRGASAFSDSPLNGLKFGKKIYFEDVGNGVLAKSSSGSSSVSVSEVGPTSAPAMARKVRGVLQGGKPPRCQVEGCKVDLSGSKAYYSRHKVCNMHSKSPKVIVAGLEKRFCQQCSRFHQLSEFDQGKRSCRRRLAGHNERRRKPQPRSLFSSCFERLSSSLQENSSSRGGFLMDFTMYPRLPARDLWLAVSGNWAPGNHSTANNPPAVDFCNPPHPYFQGSTGETVFSSSKVPPDECFAGVSDSGCALSLLSYQPLGPRNQVSGLTLNNLMNAEVASMAPHSGVMPNFMSNAWSFKGNEASGSSQAMTCDLGLGQASQPDNNHFCGELELAQQVDRQYMELGHSRAYGSSTHQMHWSP